MADFSMASPLELHEIMFPENGKTDSNLIRILDYYYYYHHHYIINNLGCLFYLLNLQNNSCSKIQL